MREILAIGMLGIFLLAVAAVQPVTASHQKLSLSAIPAISHKSLLERVSSMKDLIKGIAEKRKSLVSIVDKKDIVSIILAVLTVLAALMKKPILATMLIYAFVLLHTVSYSKVDSRLS